MSKFSKIFISLSFAFIVAFSFMFANIQPLFAKADSIATYNASFISPDNSILYSTGSYIPSGSSLQDIQNSNLITNSYFADSDTLPVNATLNGWYVQQASSFTYSINSSIPYLTINSVSGSNTKYIIYDIDTSLYRGQTLTFSANLNNTIYSITWTVKSSGTGGSTAYVTGLGISMRFYIYGDHRLGLTFDITPSSFTDPVNIYWAKCEVNSSFTGYYNSEYINDLLSSYSFSNYYYQYDIATSSAITSDRFFYPDKYTRQYDTWLVKNWGGRDTFSSSYVWTDGINYYLSDFSQHYVLDVSTSTWVSKTWNINIQFTGNDIWTDGTNYYLSNGSSQYVLDVSTSTWVPKTWTGLTSFFGMYIWTDGTSYYYSYGSLGQYVLNVSTSTWTQKTWSGLSDFDGRYIWTDGTNYYYSNDSTQMVLSGSTWSNKTWSGLSILNGRYVWTDGTNYYLSNGVSNFVLNVSTSTWSEKIFNGLTSFYGRDVWYSNFGIFYSNGPTQYVLGSSLVPLDSDYYYQSGYSDGYNTGYTGGYNNGYNTGYYTGVENAGNYTFFSLISAVIDVPIKTITGLFNFELLGVNLFNLFTGLLTLAVLLFVIKLVLGGK